MPNNPIPKKNYYVTMTDKFFSGSPVAEGKTEKFIIGCDTYDQASEIATKAKLQTGMSYVNITSSKPYYNKQRFHMSYRDYEEIGW